MNFDISKKYKFLRLIYCFHGYMPHTRNASSMTQTQTIHAEGFSEWTNFWTHYACIIPVGPPCLEALSSSDGSKVLPPVALAASVALSTPAWRLPA